MKPDSYREAFAARQPDRLLSLCAEDVTLHSPLVSEPGFEGRDVVALMLPVVLEVFEETQYTHEFGDGRSHMLVADSPVLNVRRWRLPCCARGWRTAWRRPRCCCASGSGSRAGSSGVPARADASPAWGSGGRSAGCSRS